MPRVSDSAEDVSCLGEGADDGACGPGAASSSFSWVDYDDIADAPEPSETVVVKAATIRVRKAEEAARRAEERARKLLANSKNAQPTAAEKKVRQAEIEREREIAAVEMIFGGDKSWRGYRAPQPLSREVIGIVADALEDGLREAEAMALVGRDLKTWSRWRRRAVEIIERLGEADDPDEAYDALAENERLYVDFVVATRAALAGLQNRCLRAIANPDVKRWSPFAWLLERRFGFTRSWRAPALVDEEERKREQLGADPYEEVTNKLDELFERLAAGGPRQDTGGAAPKQPG